MSTEKKESLIQPEIEQMESEESPKEREFREGKKKYILKGISSVISCIIHVCGFFSIWTIGNSVVYLISFRRHFNNNLSFSFGYFLFPILNFTIALTSPIGGFIEDKIGGKKTILLSSIIITIAFSMIYFSRNIFLDYILMSLTGFGMAIGFNITRKNACSYFMNKKALICGIAGLIPGFYSAGLAIFYEKFVLNPNSENPTIDNVYYDERIFLNFQKLIIYEIGINIVVCFFTILFYFQNDPKETVKYGFEEKGILIEVEHENKPDEIIEITDKNEKKEIIKEIKQIPKQIKIKRALKNKRAIKLFLMIFLFFPTINFVINTWRPIGIYYKLKTSYLQIIGALFSIIGCITSIIFALIGDRISFRILFCLFALFLALSSFTFQLSFHNEIFFICQIMISSFALNGFNIIIDPHMMTVYGMENYIEIGGVIKSSSGFAEMFSVIFAFYLENNFTGNKDSVYKLMYIISGVFASVSFVLGLFEEDDKFLYDD